MRRLPGWLRLWLALDGLAFAVFGLVCLLAPHLLFGAEGYRTVFRLVAGFCGGAALAIGFSLANAVRASSAAAAHVTFTTFLIAAALAPPVMTFNMGALDGWKSATGLTALTTALLVILLFATPAILALRLSVRAVAAAPSAG